MLYHAVYLTGPGKTPGPHGLFEDPVEADTWAKTQGPHEIKPVWVTVTSPSPQPGPTPNPAPGA